MTPHPAGEYLPHIPDYIAWFDHQTRVVHLVELIEIKSRLVLLH